MPHTSWKTQQNATFQAKNLIVHPKDFKIKNQILKPSGAVTVKLFTVVITFIAVIYALVL
jgi:hypothetical protein